MKPLVSDERKKASFLFKFILSSSVLELENGIERGELEKMNEEFGVGLSKSDLSSIKGSIAKMVKYYHLLDGLNYAEMVLLSTVNPADVFNAERELYEKAIKDHAEAKKEDPDTPLILSTRQQKIAIRQVIYNTTIPKEVRTETAEGAFNFISTIQGTLGTGKSVVASK